MKRFGDRIEVTTSQTNRLLISDLGIFLVKRMSNALCDTIYIYMVLKLVLDCI